MDKPSDIPNKRTMHILLNMQDMAAYADEVPVPESFAGKLRDLAEKHDAVLHLMFDGGSEPYADPDARMWLIDNYITPAGLSDEAVFADGVFRMNAQTDPQMLNAAHNYSMLTAGRRIYGSKAETYVKLADMWHVGVRDIAFASDDIRLHTVPKRMKMKVFKINQIAGEKPVRDVPMPVAPVTAVKKEKPAAPAEKKAKAPPASDTPKPNSGWRGAFKY